ncbi:nuclear receptor coactivator 7-like [Salvelinus sp. IW2-2015]|uniref:nuclear receptor coactivator 7-like n=1 Tax=Salvelinus sp. IW2-2015 TaxID=2691554 RepID=UPI0038D3CB2A
MGVNYSFEEFEQIHTKDNNTRHHKHRCCLVVEKFQLAVLCCSTAINWEIITGKDSIKPRWSVCRSEEGKRSEDEEPEYILPVLRNHSQLLNDQHIESLANHIPVRTQGIHGTWSTAQPFMHQPEDSVQANGHIDSPVLLVIKDWEKR